MKISLKQKILISVVLFIFFGIVIFIFKKSFEYNDSKIHSKVRFVQKVFYEKVNEAEKNLLKIQKLSEHIPVKNFFLDEHLMQKKDICYHIYKNDTLIFWSNNYLLTEKIDTNEIKKTKGIYNSSNGWGYIVYKKHKDYIFLAYIFLSKNYKHENDFLVDEFNPDFNLSDKYYEIGFPDRESENVIKNLQNEPIFALKIKENVNYVSIEYENVLFLIYLILFLLIARILYLAHIKLSLALDFYKDFYILGFIADLLILRILLFVFKLPSDLYKTRLFSPEFYASSDLLPSFGDLIINVIIFFIISVLLYKKLSGSSLSPKLSENIILKILIAFCVISVNVFVFHFTAKLISQIITDSTISFDFSMLNKFNLYSIIGLIIISLFIVSVLLVNIILLKPLAIISKNYTYVILFLTVFILLIFSFLNIYNIKNICVVSVLYGIFLVLYVLFRKYRGDDLNNLEVLLYLVLFTLITNWIVIKYNESKEYEKMKFLSEKFYKSEDLLAENFFNDIQKEIIKDSLLIKKILQYPKEEAETKDYITKKYFSGFWTKYKIQITLCNPYDSLLVGTLASKQKCFEFFENLKNSIGKPSTCDKLYLLNYGTGGSNYLSEMKFFNDSVHVNLYIELNSKFVQKGLGYPELLMDKKHFINTDLSEYSYAKYFKNKLVDAYGKYYYSTVFEKEKAQNKNNFTVYYKKGYFHLYNKIDDNTVVVISKKAKNILDILTSFTLFFLFIGIAFLFVRLFLKYPAVYKFNYLNFKTRLQLSIFLIVFISLFIVGFSTLRFIINLNKEKNIDLIREKTLSINIELQNKIINETDLTEPEKKEILTTLLIKFSDVFFTDINVYDTNGTLISSSRQQIFDEGLLSRKMHPLAYKELIINKKTMLIQKEQIGKLSYFSSYVPFYTRTGKALCIINLPYFARENELQKEISLFVMAFVNIYVFLIIVSIVIALFISSRITRPLNQIREKISKIKLGSKNEKIQWPRRDEIGELIDEYNRMIDELALSAELLSKSERESAWRIMAMQVAHEIKNPLTPMKLSIQYLDKAWREKLPGWEKLLERFIKNIIEQIDNLSVIASQFSYFAQMPEPKNEKLDVYNLLQEAVSIYEMNENLDIEIKIQEDFRPSIFADKNQMLRLFNNLLTNSIQSIEQDKKGIISITVEKLNDYVLISLKDNGAGIPEEMKDKIFIPNFSTKSEGMGLGLAIVKGIVENIKGEIWFESEVNCGTSFYVKMPIYQE